jgi:hypothetical protein
VGSLLNHGMVGKYDLALIVQFFTFSFSNIISLCISSVPKIVSMQ